jgi:hypothetical protein
MLLVKNICPHLSAIIIVNCTLNFMYVQIFCITKENDKKIKCQYFECNFRNQRTSFDQKHLSLYEIKK